MSTEIIEKTCISKYEDESRCEDGLFISPDYIAVVDGVTSKGNTLAGTHQRPLCPRHSANRPGHATRGCRRPGAIGILSAALAKACAPQRNFCKSSAEAAPGRCDSSLQPAARRFGRWRLPVSDRRPILRPQQIHPDNIVLGCASFNNRPSSWTAKAEDLLHCDTASACILPLLHRPAGLRQLEGPYAYDILDGFPSTGQSVSHPVPRRHPGRSRQRRLGNSKARLKETERSSMSPGSGQGPAHIPL